MIEVRVIGVRIKIKWKMLENIKNIHNFTCRPPPPKKICWSFDHPFPVIHWFYSFSYQFHPWVHCIHISSLSWTEKGWGTLRPHTLRLALFPPWHLLFPGVLALTGCSAVWLLSRRKEPGPCSDHTCFIKHGTTRCANFQTISWFEKVISLWETI